MSNPSNLSNSSNPTSFRPNSPPPVLPAPKIEVQAPDDSNNTIADISELEIGGLKLEASVIETTQNSARTHATDSTYNDKQIPGIGVTNIQIKTDTYDDNVTLDDESNYKNNYNNNKNKNNRFHSRGKKDIRDRMRFPTKYVSPDSLHMSTKSLHPYGGFDNDINAKSRDPNSILLERLRRRKGDTGYLIPLLSGNAAPTHTLKSKKLREYKIQKLKSKPIDPLMIKQQDKHELVDITPNNIIYGVNNTVSVGDITDNMTDDCDNINSIRIIKTDPGPQTQNQEDDDVRIQLKLARLRTDYHNMTLSQFKDEKMVIKSILSELKKSNYDYTCNKVELEKRSKAFRSTIKKRLIEKRDANVAKIMHAITPEFVYAIVHHWDSRTTLDISTVDRILDSLYKACVSSGFIGIQDVRPVSPDKLKEQQLYGRPPTPIGAGNIQEASIDPALLLLDKQTALLKSLNNDVSNRTATGKKISNTINDDGEMMLCCQMPSFGIRTKQVYKSLSMVNPWSSKDIALARAIKPIGMDAKVLRSRPSGISNAYLVTKLNHANSMLKRSAQPTEIINPEGLRKENLLKELSSPVQKNQYLEYISKVFLENMHEPTVTEETTESLIIQAESQAFISNDEDINNANNGKNRALSPSKERLMTELRTLSPTIDMNQHSIQINNSINNSVNMGYDYSNYGSDSNSFRGTVDIHEIDSGKYLMSPMNDSPDKSMQQMQRQLDDDSVSIDLYSTVDGDDYGFTNTNGGAGSSRGVLNRYKK